jgi:adenylate cyclase
MDLDPDLRVHVAHQLERILASPGFVRNERMSRFLRFLVERHLEGRDDELKESVIGVEVFGRRSDFDPKLDSIVRTEAARLRARLAEYYGNDGGHDGIIFEIPKGGYVPSIRRAIDVNPTTGVRRTSWTVAVAPAMLAVAVAASAAWWAWPRPTAAIPIAVLTLANLSKEPADAYFAEGLTEEIIRNLSAVEGLAVRSRTSASAVARESDDVREVGRQLSADYLVEGAVLRSNGRLRVNARLIRVRDDSPIWSGQFEREMTDVFAIQNEIARGIVHELRLNLGRGRWRYEANVPAYDLYLRARAASSLGGVRHVVAMIPTLERVIALDDGFAPAYADLARAYALRSVQFPLPRLPDELDRMRAMSAHAVALDPLLAEAHAAAGLSRARDGDWPAAEERFRQAIALAPSTAQVRSDFAMWLLHVTGRNDEALDHLQIALASDPLGSDVQVYAAWVLLALGRSAEAAVHCDASAETHSLKRMCLGRVGLAAGRLEDARREFAASAVVPNSPQSRGFLGLTLARLGERQAALAMLDAATEPTEEALIAAGLDDVDRAYAALERMTVLGAQRVGQFLNYPELAALRHDPRAITLKSRIGLPTGPP